MLEEGQGRVETSTPHLPGVRAPIQPLALPKSPDPALCSKKSSLLWQGVGETVVNKYVKYTG